MLYIEEADTQSDLSQLQGTLHFTDEVLAARSAQLAPQSQPDLITIGCPQASVGELRACAELLQGKQVLTAASPNPTPLLWIFTSQHNLEIAEQTGIAPTIRAAGALLLADTCPEVVPYDRAWVSHILTNSMKAEHYIKSGLNGIPTAVLGLADCIAFAVGERQLAREAREQQRSRRVKAKPQAQASRRQGIAQGERFASQGHGLPSQTDFVVRGEAFVTDTPITLLGFVNRKTAVIEEEGHPANGQSMAGKIAIFPKGSGSTVAPYVLLELFYRGNAPIAIVNTEIDQQTAPAASLENIPYGYQFDKDIIANINMGDLVELRRVGETITLEVAERRK